MLYATTVRSLEKAGLVRIDNPNRDSRLVSFAIPNSRNIVSVRPNSPDADASATLCIEQPGDSINAHGGYIHFPTVKSFMRHIGRA